MDMGEASALARIVVKGRWFVLFICFLIISLAGGTYIFGIYSEAIKTVLGYDQETVTTLGFFKDLGGNVGIIAGLINEIAPPWVVLGIGALMNITGYLMIWLSLTKRIAKPKLWQMYLYICIGANSHTFANTGAIVTCVKNFPESRGSVLGILKGFLGLSGAIFTQIFHAMNGHDERSLILLLAVLPSAVTLLVMLLVRPTKAIKEKDELNSFYCFLYIALALAGFLMVMIVVENKVENFPQSGYQAVAVLIMLFLLSNLAVVAKAEMDNMKLQRFFNGAPSSPLPDYMKANEQQAELGEKDSNRETRASPFCHTSWKQPKSDVVAKAEMDNMKLQRFFNEAPSSPLPDYMKVNEQQAELGEKDSNRETRAPPFGPTSWKQPKSDVVAKAEMDNPKLQRFFNGAPSSPLPAYMKVNEQQAELTENLDGNTETHHPPFCPMSWRQPKSDVVTKAEIDNMKLQRFFNGAQSCPAPDYMKVDKQQSELAEKDCKDSNMETRPPLFDPTSRTQTKAVVSNFVDLFKGPERGNDFTILQAFASMDMIILFLAATCGIGATLTAIDNMGQIGKSLGYTPVNITTFVSLISIWNFLGRVAAGFLSEFLLLKYKFPRPLMLTVALLIGCVGHIFIAFALPGSLYVASIAIGFSFGAQWPVLLAIISELFGLKYYATLYNFGAAASPVGSYLLSVKVAGALYDKEARKQLLLQAPNSSHNVLTCIGHECFRLSFIIMTLVSLFGALVSAILVVRTRKFYTSDIYSKFRVKSSSSV